MKRLAPIVILLIAACEPAEDVEPFSCESPDPGLLEVGVGDLATGFVPINDGDPVQVLLGPQGLHMIVVSARIQGYEAPPYGERARVTAATRLDGEVIGGTVGFLLPEQAEPDRYDFVGLRSVFAAEVEVFVGKQADVVITVQDACSRDVRASRRVTLVQ